MDSYQVIITPDAEEDLRELRDYIANVLFIPETAKSYLQTIKGAISRLSYMPESFALLEEELAFLWYSKN